MQTTLRIKDQIYRDAKATAAQRGITITKYIEEALVAFGSTSNKDNLEARIEERNQLMEQLLKKTAHFRIGDRPTREEMNAR